jgi:tetrapyrrole methylase family protein/MazG family protein
MTITILGLGPGNPEQITLEAWRTLEQADTVVLWSDDHIPRSALPSGPTYRLLADDFGTLDANADIYQSVVDAVCAYEDVVYAVPGDPSVIELTDRIRACAAEQGKPVRVVSGMSFIEPTLAALKMVGGRDGLQVYSGEMVAAMYHPPFNPDAPVLVAMVYTRELAERIQRILLNQYPPDHEIGVVQAAGQSTQRTAWIALDALAESEYIGMAATLYIPPHRLSYASFEAMQETMAHLRAPEGCPWDREQTHETLRPYLIEEAYEVIDAIDDGDMDELREELGDLLLQVVFHAQVAVEAGEFRMADIINGINTKLIRRHPHVWGSVDVNGSDDVTRNWDAIKKQERKHKANGKKSLLDGISKALPALSQAYNYQVRAARIGFDWDRIEPVIDKVSEEIAEIQAADNLADRAAEIGDLLFALVNWIRWMKVEPETALRDANQRFYRRFRYIEEQVDNADRLLSDMTLEELDTLWDEAKAQGL